MSHKKPMVEDFTDAAIKISPPKEWAVGIPAIEHALLPALGDMGPERSTETSLAINHRRGFDCPSCAWADPDKQRSIMFCENGFKSIVWEATPLTIPDSFWVEHSLSSLKDKSEYWLGNQGRITRPMYKAADSDHYEPISWERAFELAGEKLKSLESPDEAVFYTSGRIMNEPAFLFQLLARELGTNNLPDCSNMCHEATGAGMGAAIGIGKSSVNYSDFADAELVIVMGQNPGTNHPRMLNALEQTKDEGGEIVGVNVLPEASLLRYKNPQKPRGVVGKGTVISDQFIHIRTGGDQHLLRAIAKRVIIADQENPGAVDHEFIDQYCEGYEAYRDEMLAVDDKEVLLATGLKTEEIDELAERYIRSNATIITWALGITQHRKAVGTITDAMNLLLLRGNIGKPGAGASPVRGHSNVQGDRTMGIWEQMPDSFLDALDKEFQFETPREHGLDTVNSVNAMEDGKVRFFMSMAGNLVAAVSDSRKAEEGMSKVEMTVQVSTKLNRSHVITGKEALILPVLGRTEKDIQETGLQYVTSEDTVCRINKSSGDLKPVAEGLLSDVSVVARLAQSALPDSQTDWQGFESDYGQIRDSISRVIPGFENFNQRLEADETFVLPHGPRDSRTFPTPSGKAQFNLEDPEHFVLPEKRLWLQSMRAHDQHNTTIYGLDDRYRGVSQGRFVLFISPEDIAELGLADGQTVDIFSEWEGEPDRVLRGYRVVSYPTKKGCAAMYFPEANELVPRASVADGVNTPTSKQIVIRIEPGDRAVPGSRPIAV